GPDARAYSKVFGPLARHADDLIPEILSPPIHMPRHPLRMLAFGIKAIQSAQKFAERRFNGERARALFAGIAAAGNIPLDLRPTAATGLLLGLLGHAGGWPLPKGGAQKISNA